MAKLTIEDHCPNCGSFNKSSPVSYDVLGIYTVCPNCEGSHDINVDGLAAYLIAGVFKEGKKEASENQYLKVPIEESFLERRFPHGYIEKIVAVRGAEILHDDQSPENVGKSFAECYPGVVWESVSWEDQYC